MCTYYMRVYIYIHINMYVYMLYIQYTEMELTGILSWSQKISEDSFMNSQPLRQFPQSRALEAELGSDVMAMTVKTARGEVLLQVCLLGSYRWFDIYVCNMHVYIYTYICAGMHVCMYIYIYVSIYIYIYVYIRDIYQWKYTYINICYTYIYIFRETSLQTPSICH